MPNKSIPIEAAAAIVTGISFPPRQDNSPFDLTELMTHINFLLSTNYHYESYSLVAEHAKRALLEQHPALAALRPVVDVNTGDVTNLDRMVSQVDHLARQIGERLWVRSRPRPRELPDNAVASAQIAFNRVGKEIDFATGRIQPRGIPDPEEVRLERRLREDVSGKEYWTRELERLLKGNKGDSKSH